MMASQRNLPEAPATAVRHDADGGVTPVGGPGRLAHVVACLLVALTTVLLGFGAMVTTFDAAMAVPDWPATYGHNMFLFPFAEWFYGPFDLFLEHGHRLLGAAVGLASLVLAGVVWRSHENALVRALTVAAVLLVVVQGLLGGARVLLDDTTVAKVHACTGPLFFAVAVAIATLTRPGMVHLGSPVRIPAALLIAAYVQLVAGAQLRHLDATVAPTTFRTLVALHVVGAVAVTVLAVVSAAVLREEGPAIARRWSTVIVALVGCQLLLGVGAWVAKWGVPSGLVPEAWQWSEPLQARSAASAAVITGHVLLGIAILGGAVVLAIHSGMLSAVRARSTAEGRLANGRVFA
jgi:cytochrome c oxidase assembly protein subunit 15